MQQPLRPAFEWHDTELDDGTALLHLLVSGCRSSRRADPRPFAYRVRASIDDDLDSTPLSLSLALLFSPARFSLLQRLCLRLPPLLRDLVGLLGIDLETSPLRQRDPSNPLEFLSGATPTGSRRRALLSLSPGPDGSTRAYPRACVTCGRSLRRRSVGSCPSRAPAPRTYLRTGCPTVVRPHRPIEHYSARRDPHHPRRRPTAVKVLRPPPRIVWRRP